MFAELKNVEIKAKILLREDNNHFNLVIDKNDDLAVFGILSYRYNVGPLMEENTNSVGDLENIEKANESELVTVKKELNKCEKSKTFIDSEYYKCEKELKNY